MGHVFVVGLGTGTEGSLSGEARGALEAAEVLCGYTGYLERLRPLYPDKETFATPMRGELERCRRALALAQEGRTVALVCSGDAGVYGMASPVLELLPEYPRVEVQVVPGITAALSCAAALGAPLGNDFCVISLSDLLTPWEVIERRLLCAARGDFVLCLYNPASHRRREPFARACQLLLRERGGDTLCGWVRHGGREGEEKKLLPLSQLAQEQPDMFTTVFIGASTTREIAGRMVTPRGYPT